MGRTTDIGCRVFDCPTCGAPAGDPCLSVAYSRSGLPRAVLVGHHAARAALYMAHQKTGGLRPGGTPQLQVEPFGPDMPDYEIMSEHIAMGTWQVTVLAPDNGDKLEDRTALSQAVRSLSRKAAVARGRELYFELLRARQRQRLEEAEARRPAFVVAIAGELRARDELQWQAFLALLHPRSLPPGYYQLAEQLHRLLREAKGSAVPQG